MLNAVDDARRSFDRSSMANTWHRQQERAYSLLLSSRTTEAFDVAREPESLRKRYGEGINGLSLLLARRLVKRVCPLSLSSGWAIRKLRKLASAPVAVVGIRMAITLIA